MVEPRTPKVSNLAMFNAMEDWSTSFKIDGQTVGGPFDLCNDQRMLWLLDVVGGAQGKRVLELGPLEGAHTKIIVEHGAHEVTAIEGFRPNWLKCLVIKEIFGLNSARFLYGDFCQYVAEYEGPPFDFTVAVGVLYHQQNPAILIHDLSKLTDQVLVWSQVADNEHPVGGADIAITVGDRIYRGRINDYQGAENTVRKWYGGVHPTAVWLYPEDLRRAFVDAGFEFIVDQPLGPTPYGPSVLFGASKKPR